MTSPSLPYDARIASAAMPPSLYCLLQATHPRPSARKNRSPTNETPARRGSLAVLPLAAL
jgi:hypothetical protein